MYISNRSYICVLCSLVTARGHRFGRIDLVMSSITTDAPFVVKILAMKALRISMTQPLFVICQSKHLIRILKSILNYSCNK